MGTAVCLPRLASLTPSSCWKSAECLPWLQSAQGQCPVFCTISWDSHPPPLFCYNRQMKYPISKKWRVSSRYSQRISSKQLSVRLSCIWQVLGYPTIREESVRKFSFKAAMFRTVRKLMTERWIRCHRCSLVLAPPLCLYVKKACSCKHCSRCFSHSAPRKEQRLGRVSSISECHAHCCSCLIHKRYMGIVLSGIHGIDMSDVRHCFILKF